MWWARSRAQQAAAASHPRATLEGGCRTAAALNSQNHEVYGTITANKLGQTIDQVLKIVVTLTNIDPGMLWPFK